MLLKGVQRLGTDGLDVVVVDPNQTLKEDADIDSGRTLVVDSIDELVADLYETEQGKSVQTWRA